MRAHIMYEKYGDNSMRQIFIDGTGYYETMAMRTFDLPRENCEDKALDPTGTFSPRAMMKTIVSQTSIILSAYSETKAQSRAYF